MNEHKSRSQRLYLLKGDTDESNIYVDTVSLPQHQYDGVRFLYRQFKKGKAGVVLNDPSGYGKRVQTLLFLNAMSPILTLPTLILCPEGRENMWMHLFHEWTNIGSDITAQHGSDYIKSMGVIGNFTQISVLARREWGILVVDDNSVSREVLRSGITAMYRIWITTIDMKKNLQTFSMIYKWLYPRDRFIVEDFQITRKTPTSVLINSTRLDAFMEDVVIRRRDVMLPLGRPQHTLYPPRVSRKNKDATGKKIKRSKPLPVYSQDTSGESEDMGSKETMSEVSKNGKVESKNESIEDFVVNVENNRKADDVIHDSLTQSDINLECKDIQKHSKEKLESEDKVQETDKMEVDLNKTVNNKLPENELVNKSNSQNDSITILYSDIESQNILLKYDSDSPELVINEDATPITMPKLSNEINFTTNNNEVSASQDLFSMDTETSDIKSDNVINKHNIKSDILETKTTLDVKNSENIPKNSTNDINDEIKGNDLNNKNELDKNNVSENKTEATLVGIELKVKQMEELAIKKFKGTFLDSIF